MTIGGRDGNVSGADVQFVLMLTEKDVTIPDAMKVYSRLTVDSLSHVAFKDVGADRHLARELTDAAHADGRSVLLELADLSEAGQDKGLQLAIDAGVDRVVGAWRVDFARALMSDTALEYWPFVGSMSGSPLVLDSTPGELAAIVAEVSGTRGVSGVVLMPYRQTAFAAEVLLESTAAAATAPFLVAGGVRHASQISAITRAGAWGFTMGGAVLADRADDPESVTRHIAAVMQLCLKATDRPFIDGHTGRKAW